MRYAGGGVGSAATTTTTTAGFCGGGRAVVDLDLAFSGSDKSGIAIAEISEEV